MQELQHAKEQKFIDYLLKHCTNVKDVHDNFSTGIDVYIDCIPYDLKITNSRKLTIFKRYKGNWYSPLLEHTDIDYLLVEEYDKCYLGFVINKAALLRQLGNKCISTYTGDGNINQCVELGDPTLLCEKVYTWMKD